MHFYNLNASIDVNIYLKFEGIKANSKNSYKKKPKKWLKPQFSRLKI